MRIYIPLEPAELTSPVITARVVHSATAELAKTCPQYDQEELEVVASLAAADDALRLLAKQTAPQVLRRIVAVAEVPNTFLCLPAKDKNLLPTALLLQTEVSWGQVESFLLDEPGAESVVATAITGDEDAFIATEDIELLWYDVSERLLIANSW